MLLGAATDRRTIMAGTQRTDVISIRDRYQSSFDATFMPNFRYEQMPGADERLAYAGEFAAYRLGQIDEKLGHLIEIMQRRSAQPS
jgi:hypothetical protein